MIKPKFAIAKIATSILMLIILCGNLQAQERWRNRADGAKYMEVMPQFSGGQQGLQNFIIQNLRYPQQAEKDQIEGQVIAMFLINLEGEIEQIRIVKSVNPDLDNEVIRMIKSMPKWEPGKTITIKDGRESIDKVKTFYTLPVNFKLSPSKKNR